jgi:hypothetical protein
MNVYQHDHDGELRRHWYDPSNPSCHDTAYWLETGRLVREYLKLRAGDDYTDALRQGFVGWLQRSPAERRLYVSGDDVQRAALVDWFLKVVR